MTSTPPDNSNISDSWVDLSSAHSGGQTPVRVTPVPFGGEQDYLRMLREAQRESNRSSAKVSPISSALMSLSSTTRNTPSASPKSPPNSPNPELSSLAEELKDVYINPASGAAASATAGGSTQAITASELIWDWSSRPNLSYKEWKSPLVCTRSRQSSDSSKQSSSAAGEEGGNKKKGLFYSKGVLYTLLLTNLVSLLIGAGFGMWLSRRGGGGASQTLVEIGV